MTDSLLPRYSRNEEIANSITHGLGIVFSVVGLAVLTAFSGIFGTAWHVVSCSIYGSTLIILYTASTLYHSVQEPRKKQICRIFDHSAIFILIAGTYTPFTLVNLRGPWGWTLFGLIWGLAVLGIILSAVSRCRCRTLSIILYVGMGWVVVVAFKPLLSSVQPGGLVLLLTGGIFYTSGLAFYGWKRLRYHHALWHVMVLLGSMFHFFAVLFYVIPIAG
ncbi:PAQR family membrane homeostasis protein TrhA [Desulfonatronovibrio hydrogenovorans]|uniref:PAQR family membrane homeostasis protein TrhA n=1 Tax=Desulfonatronovibrio hydrogenovorans TaxID=53245 RepID=UPI000490FC08|nr:hemolysin III family protein [Desulfonatronovibrio hydrogenovorans]